jgi:hypothetical protein
MNPKFLSEPYNAVPHAFEINQHARRQEKLQAYLEAEWKFAHQKPAPQQPSWLKVLCSRLLTALAAPIRPLAPARRQQNQF